MTVLISDHDYPLISIGEAMTEPLTAEELRAIRDRDATWFENPNGSFTAYSVEPGVDMSDHTEAAFRDRRRLLATLDAARGSTGLTDELRRAVRALVIDDFDEDASVIKRQGFELAIREVLRLASPGESHD